MDKGWNEDSIHMKYSIRLLNNKTELTELCDILRIRIQSFYNIINNDKCKLVGDDS